MKKIIFNKNPIYSVYLKYFESDKILLNYKKN